MLSIATKLSNEPDGLGIVAPLPRGDTTDVESRWSFQAGQEHSSPARPGRGHDITVRPLSGSSGGEQL